MHDELLDGVKFGPDGLVTAIAQDYESGEVLMLAYMNEETLRQTLDTNIMTYWSRSRRKVWVKGESSGNIQDVREIRIDCDGDALLFKVAQRGGAACHTGFKSCFHRRYDSGTLKIEGQRIFDPDAVYGSKGELS